MNAVDRRSLPDDAVIGIVAGGGVVPDRLRDHLLANGRIVRTIALSGEATVSSPDVTLGIGDIEGLLRMFREFRLTHAVLVGWVRRRPRLRDGRIGWRTLRAVPPLLRNLARGDDAILRAVVSAIEAQGVAVLGVHELWPDLLATAGALGDCEPDRSQHQAIERGAEIARALGRFDVGQGVVVVGKRAIALEGLEGTDRMLDRVASLRAEGAVRQRGGVLVKVAKPAQELRTDLPSVGPDTVLGAAATGLSGIAVEAGRSLVVDRERTVVLANERGLFLWGLPTR